jgi:stage III sporulation protein AA
VISDIRISEIRLAIGRPVCVRGAGYSAFLTARGTFTHEVDEALICSEPDMEYSFTAVCEDSVHSFERELREGFITIPGGHRVGLCGTAVMSGDRIKNIRDISSMNFRIARQITGCSDMIYRELLLSGACGILIVGAPSSGKTTLLRDLCRNAASRYRVSVIDERGEIAAVSSGEPQNDIGPMSDVFNGYTRKKAMETAVRVMSPDIIVCDEIGSRSDMRAVMSAMNSGVSIIASVHAGSREELMRKKDIVKLIKKHAFSHMVFIDSADRACTLLSAEEFMNEC